MSDPKRWCETEGEPEETLVLLSALSKVEPSVELRESMWAKIAATLPPVPGSESPPDADGSAGGTDGGPTPGGASGAGASAAAAKAAGLGGKLAAPTIAGAVALASVAIWLLSAPAQDPTGRAVNGAASTEASTTTPVVASPSSAVALAAKDAPKPPAPTTTTTTTHGDAPDTVPDAPSVASVARKGSTSPLRAPTTNPSTALAPADRLREEADGVRRVRQLLRAKDAPAALAELDRLARLAPNGPLEEEREVLTIEAMASGGDAAAARRRAERFLFERPRSVHAARVRSLAAGAAD